MGKIKALFASRRFWVGVAGVIVICADTVLGEGTIDPTTVQNVVLLAASWIVGDSIRVTE
ncbi:MAG: hypothetical protein FI729_03290 [SAR202 cluster bacterium]|nr:hypothetical protein [SAR202 cluster bacterium]|tara:strand:- start:5204 stop:5383 length:180 start_codon:yes stop_codon:yes gene_type:complete